MEQPSIEISGVKYFIDASKVTMGDWLELVSSMGAGNQTRTAEYMLKIVVSALGPPIRELPITYISVIIPRVMEHIGRAMFPESIESEVNEILNFKRDQES
jgi:hypothetical protein